MYTKGSDQVLQNRLIPSPMNQVTFHLLNKYANKGLRTLVIASRVLKKEYFDTWKYKYDKL